MVGWRGEIGEREREGYSISKIAIAIGAHSV